MTSVMDTLFGPIPREYCSYFYIMSVLFGFAFLLFIISMFSILIFKGFNQKLLLNISMLAFNTFLGYLANRLFYTMCVRTL